MKKNITINLCGRLFQIDEDAYEMLQEYIESLRSSFGKQEGCDEIVNDIEARIAELFAELNQQGIEAITIDHVKDIYRKRAAVIGFRCGVIFHLLTGCSKESKACLDFATMMAEYCLQQQIAAFGEALQSQYVDAQDECQRYGANHSVFDQLAPVFTVDDLRALKRGFCSDVSLRKIISRWMRDGWIEKTDQKHWGKTKIDKA